MIYKLFRWMVISVSEFELIDKVSMFIFTCIALLLILWAYYKVLRGVKDGEDD